MRGELSSRYLFKGEILLQSGLHIGGGDGHHSFSDSPVVTTSSGEPFIPGSSFKGAFRSTVERIIASLPGFEACLIYESESSCPSVNLKKYHNKQEAMEEDRFAELVQERLCDCCKLFGSPFLASSIYFQDLYPNQWSEVIPVRDGVGIDRDSERAVDQVKYDYEVVEVGTSFAMEIHLDNPSSNHLSLVSVGLMELIKGNFFLGGLKSRGLGRCNLNRLEIHSMCLQEDSVDANLEILADYLKAKTSSDGLKLHEDPEGFLKEHIDSLVDSSRRSLGEGG